MGKKRRSEDSAESSAAVKKVPEFNGTVFKAMLKEPTTAMKGEFTITLCYVINASYLSLILGDVFISISTIHARFDALSPAGLEKFISTAKKLPCSDLYDVVEGYIKISMECAEIFKLLEGEKHTETEVSSGAFLRGLLSVTWGANCSSNPASLQMMLIFESLEMILLRTASDLSHFNMVGNAIVKKTVSSYMKLLQGSFHSENHRFD